MDATAPPELTRFVNIVPGYSEVLMPKNLWMIICLQWFLCFVWSVLSSYYAYKKLYGDPEKSWNRVVQSVSPILKRIQNLEKEKTIWYSYMEWIEEYCNVYYGLLNYTNMKVGDLDKLIKSSSLKSGEENIEGQKKLEEVIAEKDEVVSNEKQWKDLGSLNDYQMLTDFATVVQTLKTIQNGTESEGTEAVDDLTRSLTTSDLPSTAEMTEDYFRDELESFKESSDDDKFACVTNKKAFHQLAVYHLWTSLLPSERRDLVPEPIPPSVQDPSPTPPSNSQPVKSTSNHDQEQTC